jgi:hypothetical protein
MMDEGNRIFAITYSYPTWDKYYRGQRGVRVEASTVAHALILIREGMVGGYGPCPDAQIVRVADVTERVERNARALSLLREAGRGVFDNG